MTQQQIKQIAYRAERERIMALIHSDRELRLTAQIQDLVWFFRCVVLPGVFIYSPAILFWVAMTVHGFNFIDLLKDTQQYIASIPVAEFPKKAAGLCNLYLLTSLFTVGGLLIVKKRPESPLLRKLESHMHNWLLQRADGFE